MKTTKQFNLEMFKKGVKAQTKLGNPAKFITIDARGKLVVAVLPRFGVEESVKYTLDGKKYNGTETMYDLEMVEPYKVIA
jgi:hypothetical protein